MAFDNQEVELRVGETVRLGRVRVTVIDIDNGEVTFQVEDPNEGKDTRPPDLTGRPR